MKVKKFLAIILTVALLAMIFVVPAFAGTASMSASTLSNGKATFTLKLAGGIASAEGKFTVRGGAIDSISSDVSISADKSSGTFAAAGSSRDSITITVVCSSSGDSVTLTYNLDYVGDGNGDDTTVSPASGSATAKAATTAPTAKPTAKPTGTTKPTTTKPKTTASTAANLKSLTVEGFELNEKFSGGRTSYSITVPKDTKSINVSAIPLNSNCKVTGIGTLNITGLPQTFRIVCKAPNGETKTYTLTVKAAADPTIVNLTDLVVSSICELTPEFDPSVYEYTAIVPAGTKAVNVDAIIDEVTYEGATVKVVGADDLAASNNTVTITVTAKDGTETTYTIHVKFAEEEKTVAPAPVEEKSGVPVWVVILLVVLLIVCSVVAFLLGKKKGEEAYDDSDDGYDDNSFEEIDRDSFIHSVDD